MSERTKGKLKVAGDFIQFDDGAIVAELFGGNQPADAVHLVAAWNALEDARLEPQDVGKAIALLREFSDAHDCPDNSARRSDRLKRARAILPAEPTRG